MRIDEQKKGSSLRIRRNSHISDYDKRKETGEVILPLQDYNLVIERKDCTCKVDPSLCWRTLFSLYYSTMEAFSCKQLSPVNVLEMYVCIVN